MKEFVIVFGGMGLLVLALAALEAVLK